MRSNPSKIAVIILNWNNAPDTLECLASVFASQKVSLEVYVADNGSTDGSLEILRQAYPNAIYVENKENLGFAEGNNRAIEQALKGDAEFLFLLNNDAIVREDTLSILREAARMHPEGAVFGPKIYYYDAPATIWYGGGEWDPERASFYHRDWNTDEEETLRKTAVEKTGYVCGCALFIRTAAVKQVGLMDPRFFLNWEEIDWCWRLRKEGFFSFFVPLAKCWHKISRSFIGGKKGPMWLYFYWRNRFLWMEKNLSKKEFFHLSRRVVWPKLKGEIREALIGQGGRKRGARAALHGVFDYFSRRFGAGPQWLSKKKK